MQNTSCVKKLQVISGGGGGGGVYPLHPPPRSAPDVLFGCLLPIYKCATWENARHLSRQIVLSCWSSGFTQSYLTQATGICHQSHFLFDSEYYDQIDGVSMGSPLGPVLANIFMCDFEKKWLIDAKVSPLFWNRCVDETLTMFRNKEKANEFLHYL